MNSSNSTRTVERAPVKWWIPFGFAGLAFAADMAAPIGFAVWSLYLPAILSCLGIRRPWAAVRIAALSSVLVVARLLFSPSSWLPMNIAITNRATAVVVLWICAIFVARRIRDELALDASAKLLNTVGAHSPVAIYVKDLSARLLYANPTAAKLLSRDGSRVESTNSAVVPNCWIKMGSEAAQPVSDIDRQVMATGISESIEEVISSGHEERYWLSTRSPWRDSEGTIVGLVGVSHDVTHRKQEMDVLRRSEERYRLALEASELGTWDEDMRSRQSRLNKTAFAIFGESPRDAPVTPEFWSLRVHHEDWPGVQKAYADALENGTLYHCEHRICRSDGSVRWLAPYGRFLCDAAGAPERFVGVFRDITEQKNKEVVLRENQEALRGHALRQSLLLELSGALIAGGNDERAIVQAVFRLLSEPLQLDACFNYRLNASHGLLHLVGGEGIPSQHLAATTSLEVGEAFCGSVAASKQPIVADETRITSDSAGELVHRMDLRAYACHPLVAGNGTVLGTLSFATRRRDRFSPEEVSFLQTVCHFVALAWERLDGERALSASRADLQLALNIGQIGQWSWDALNDRIEWSEQLVRANGYAPSEFGANLYGLLSRILPEDRPVLLHSIDRAIRNNGDLNYEFRILRKDGSLRWARARGRAEVDAGGRLLRVTGIDFDITEQKQAESERSHFAAIVESSSDAIVSKDLQGIVTSWNRGAERLFGYSATEMIGQSIGKIIPEDRRDEEKAILDQIRLGEVLQHYETIRVRKDGSLVPVSLSISPVKDAQWKIIGGSKIARDITERKQADEALRRSAAQLKIEDQRKDEFLAMLAHELRNPLMPILNASEFLRRRAGSAAETDAQLSILHRQAMQLCHLVDDLLDVSRISQGRIELNQQPLEIGVVIDQALETVQTLIGTKRQRVTLVKPAQGLYVRGDRTRLVQSVGNLLHNAAKYTDPAGDIRLTVRETDTYITVEVCDSGAGISSELLPHVFDLFVQSKRTLDRSQGGLGIGLSVVKHLIDLHGGSTYAHSSGLGQGSTFAIRLPRIAAPIQEYPSRELPNAPHRRILVVDDNSDVADSLAMLLALQGHEVRAVYSAAAALELAQTEPPEVVILDIGLPDVNGYEVARRLRENHSLPAICLVAVTGYGQAEDLAKAKAAGFDHHLVKPANLEALQGILAR